MFYGEWSNSKEVFSAFKADADDRKDAKIIFAHYTYEDYSGNAFVLFTRNGKLYEVNGSHCSCYGLEGQWEPEETNVEALQHRIRKGTLGKFYDGYYKKEIRESLKNL